MRTSDLDQLAAPFAERIRSKQQLPASSAGRTRGLRKEVYPERSSSELIRELGPRIRRARVLGAVALRPDPAALRVLWAAVPVSGDPGGGPTARATQ